MAPTTNGRVVFNEVPTGYPDPAKTVVYDSSQTLDPDAALPEGGFLLKTLFLSIDPYLRGRMREASKKSYHVPFLLGEPISNHGVGVVVRSSNDALKAGDYVYGIFTFQEYCISTDAASFRVVQNILPSLGNYVGVAGMPGETAYYAWNEYYTPKKGDVAFVSAGAGPVGSFVVQLAKRDGLKVIASAGSADKVKFLKEIGADVAFNYKEESTVEVLEREGPINVYWDNVGGETLDAALGAAALGATFIECGMISGYNTGHKALQNIQNIVGKSLRIFGFIVNHIRAKYEAEFYGEIIPKWIASGEIKFTEDVREGLQSVGQAIYDVQAGKNTGKLVIKVADP